MGLPRSLAVRVATCVAALAVALVIAGGAIGYAGVSGVPPERSTGTPGSVQILDASDSPGVRCRYAAGNPAALQRFVVQAPSVSWPNRHSTNNHEHGTVTYQILIQRQANGLSTVWTNVWKSPKQSATVYESTSVPFEVRTIPWMHSGARWYRILIKLVWSTPSGVIGTLKHWYNYYEWTGGGADSTFSGGCVSQAS